MRKARWVALVCAGGWVASAPAAPPQPVIDVHLHASGMGTLGGHVVNCGSPIQEFAPRDGRELYGVSDVRSKCDKPLVSASSDAEYEAAVLKNLEDLNITAVLSGPLDRVLAWRAKATTESRIIPAIQMGMPGSPSVEAMRKALTSGQAAVIGEIGAQYQGIGPDHVLMEPYFALAEQLDVPIAIHMGLGAPAAAYVGQESYLASLSNPLLLEPVLRRHPRLRIQVMHAAWPMIDQMIAMMYSHPQIYVDTGIIDWGIPRKEFYSYLKRLVEAGFGNRIMYGSDEFLWPEAMKISIEAIESADFLTSAQKRDILYNNAVRFLRLNTAANQR